MRNPAESQDEDDGPIYEPVKLTPYDRSRNDLRELETKRDAILAQNEITEHDQQYLAVLGSLIVTAQQRFEREGKRALDDTYRKRRGIDEWRAGEGREQRNQSRRKVRTEPNADLSDLSPDQKKQRKLDQVADNRWMKRCRVNGWSEARIQAELVARIHQRKAERATQVQDDEAERAAQAQEDAAEAEMQSNPMYGMFS